MCWNLLTHNQLNSIHFQHPNYSNKLTLSKLWEGGFNNNRTKKKKTFQVTTLKSVHSLQAGVIYIFRRYALEWPICSKKHARWLAWKNETGRFVECAAHCLLSKRTGNDSIRPEMKKRILIALCLMRHSGKKNHLHVKSQCVHRWHPPEGWPPNNLVFGPDLNK